MKIGIIVAMKKELNLLRIGLENKKNSVAKGGTFAAERSAERRFGLSSVVSARSMPLYAQKCWCVISSLTW